MAYNSVQGRYFAGKQVKCEFVSLTRWKVAICGEYMKSRVKTCSRGSECNFLHCFSNHGGDYEWADCDKPPPRYWVKKMTALFGYSDDFWHDKQIDQHSPEDHQHYSRIFTSDRNSYDKKRQRSIETNQHNRSSSRNHHHEDEENHDRKSRSRDCHKENKYYENEKDNKYNNHIAEDTDSDGDCLNSRNTHRRHRDSSENHSGHYSRGSKSRDYHYGISSDEEDLYKDKRRVNTKRKSQHRKNDSESKDERTEAELQRHKQDKTDTTRHHHRRSTRRNNRYGLEESDEEPSTKKQKSRSRSRDSACILEKKDTSDRWEPNTSPDEHKSIKENDRKPKDKRSSRETRSGSVEQELNNLQDGCEYSQGKGRESRHRKRI